MILESCFLHLNVEPYLQIIVAVLTQLMGDYLNLWMPKIISFGH